MRSNAGGTVKRTWSLMVVGGLTLGLSTAVAGDIPGSRDPSFLKRYAGSEIVFSSTRSFDDYKLVVPDPSAPTDSDKWTSEAREGSVTRILYRVPGGHTALELFRNYEQAVKESGLQIAYELQPCQQRGREPADRIWNLVQSTGLGANLLVHQTGSYVFSNTVGPYCFLTAKGNKDGQDIGLTVGVVEERAGDAADRQTTVANSKPIVFQPGEIIVLVDVVASKPLENKMVEVKATDMADALASKGSIDLYGIYFDTDKTDIKPESAKTLEQIAELLKIDRSLKLEVAGHTDNTGTKEHNQSLSQGRAQAVVDALVKNYGIDAQRLQAKGYGDTKPVADNGSDAGRAKNRRVELRKIS